ncbi:hypothetical protein [Magnetospirillum aberrantis]|uniref:Porin family protein n=1 Tax=Magnetospirillum aberrantis SpK TaxID=908842 RepID=A0A7C9UW57_9PROT|nr:hypothetical protein [Magnetospirillum aberrantis]NFV80489.1 hypothetical protein [Magnetospirillum aberrantis SpK]
MRRLLLSATAAMIVLAAALPARGGDAPYDPNWAVALKGGVWDSDIKGVDAAAAYGVEISVDDPLIDPVIGKVRHMMSFNHADHDGLDLSTVEWNAHWVFETHRDFWLGAGPGIGYVWADGHNMDNSPAAQFGMSATYFHDHAMVGFETRYQWTSGDSTDNWLTMVKVGYRF